MGVVFLEPGSWNLTPENAAACASLLPRIQTTGIRNRVSALMPIRLRLGRFGVVAPPLSAKLRFACRGGVAAQRQG
jgi:hypothetical protein